MKPRTTTHFAARFVMTLLAVFSATTAWADRQSPVSCIDLCKGGIGEICINGWAYDPAPGNNKLNIIIVASTKKSRDEEGYEEIVATTIFDGESYEGYPIERVNRQDVNTAHNLPAGDYGFRARLPLYEMDYIFGENNELPMYVKIYARTYDYNPSNPYHDYQFLLYESPDDELVNVINNWGNGTEDRPFEIFNANHWDLIADAFNDSDLYPFYANNYFQLHDEDGDEHDYQDPTPITKMLGTSARPFAGHFDGNGKTLNVNISSTAECAAPFSRIDHATIRNLTVTGTVSSSGNHAAGLVGGCANACVITDCTVLANVSGAPYAGGIVGHGGNDNLTIERCAYGGSISGFTYFAGGILGWCDDLTLDMQECLFKGEFSPGSGGKYHPIALKYAPKTVTATVSDIYYVHTEGPSIGLGNNSIAEAEGVPVNTTRVPLEWTNGFVALDGNTYYLACIPPVGSIEDCKGVVTHIYMHGWAYDPNFPSTPIDLEAHVYSDEACANEVKSMRLTTNVLRTDVNATYRLTDNHGFDAHIPIDEAGTYYVKLFAIDEVDGDMQIGETAVVTVAPNTSVPYTKYSAFDYHVGSPLNDAGSFVNLVDNDWGTEWLAWPDGLGTHTAYVDFRSATAIVPTGYSMSFIGNAVTQNQYKPVSWVIKACRNLEDEWTTITTVTDHWFPFEANFEFTIENVTESYRYFRFEVTAVNYNGAGIKVAELQLKGYPDGAEMGHSPNSGLDRCEALSDRILVEGWAYDPDVPSESVDVYAYVYTDEACTQELKHVSMWANHSRPDVNTAQGITGDHGFHGYIPISDAGTYYVKFMAIDITGDEDRQIGATQTMTITKEPRSFVKNITFVQDVINYNTENRDTYRAMGWSETNHIISNIYLFYNYESGNGQYNYYITDFYLSTAANPVPDEITHNGRTYYLAPYYPSDSQMGKKNGDINATQGAGPHHLYYTRDTFDDNRAVTGITVNDDPNGALGANGGTQAENVAYSWGPKYIHFTTAPAYPVFAMKVPYSFSFERSMDEDGWKYLGYNGWVTLDGYFTVESRDGGYLMSPLFDTDAPMKVEFDIQGNGYNTFYFGYSKTTNDLSEFKWEGGQTTMEWQHFEYEAPIGTKYIAIHYVNSIYNIDNFNFTTNYNIAPKDFTVIEQNPLSATLAWTASETSATVLCYKYQYKKWGYEEWSDELSVSDPTVTISGLSYDTQYDFRVRAFYENNTYSKYLNGSFHTMPMPQPVQLYLTDLTDQTATISWSAPASEFTPVGYTYQFKKDGDSDWSAETYVGASTTTATFSGMTANMGCHFRVKANYAEGASPYTTFDFSTPIVLELPHECGFENGMYGLVMLNAYLPSLLSDIYTGINSANDRPGAALDGEHAFMFLASRYKLIPQYLMSQLLPEGVIKKLTFYYRTKGMGYHERFQVGYSTTSNDPSTFTWEPEVETYDFENYTKYEMQAPTDARYVAIRYLSDDKYSIYIDNLSIDTYSDKAAPTNLVATDLVDQLATQLTWSAPNASFTDYAYQYKKAVENTWSPLTPTTATTVTLTGLTVNTDYQFRVQARYADGSSSNFITVSFESDGGIQSLPYEWGFEGGLDGFRVFNNVRDTRHVNFTWHRGNYSFRFSPTNGTNPGALKNPQYLISPQFNTQKGLKVSFYYCLTGDEDDIYAYSAVFQMGYSTQSNAIDDFQWFDTETVSGVVGWQQYVCYIPEGAKFVAVKWQPGDFLFLDDFRFEETTYILLADNADNTTAVSEKDGCTSCSVHLDGRTLYRDGGWNTLCVPFTLNSFGGTPLDGFVAKELDTENSYEGHVTGLENGTLYLNFKDATTILPGRPYIVKYVGLEGYYEYYLTYHAQNGSDAMNGPSFYNLVDDGINTYWYTSDYEQANDRWFCDFSISHPLSIRSYSLDPGSNMNKLEYTPRIWTLKARAKESDEWTLIDSRNVSENSADAMSTNDPKFYYIASDKLGIYQYFRFEVYSTGGDYLQLDRLELHGTISSSGVDDIANPVFEGVTVSAAAPQPVTFSGGQFVGKYSPLSYKSEDKSILFLGANNTLYYPQPDLTDASNPIYPSINAFRAYFDLTDPSDPSNPVKGFVLNFGDDNANGIENVQCSMFNVQSEAWYDLDGRRLSGKPTQRGIYIHNGKKVSITPNR